MKDLPEESEFTRYYRQFPDYNLTTAESMEYLRRIMDGDRAAKDTFINCNMRLVMFCVLKYVKHDDPRAMDLVGEGTLGLYRAIDKFDVTRNFKFSTYAVHWIKSKIRRALRKFKKERSTVINNLAKQYDTAKTILTLAIKEMPSEQAIQNYLGWDNHTMRLYHKFNDDRALICHIQEDTPPLPSNVEPPSALVEDIDMSDRLTAALMRLNPVESDIIRRYYGYGINKQTYDEIGRFYGMTKEWVRQTEGKALRKLFILVMEGQIPPDLLKPKDPSPEEEGS